MKSLQGLEKSVQEDLWQQFQALSPDLKSTDPIVRAAATARLETLEELMKSLQGIEKSVQKNAWQQLLALIPDLESPDPIVHAPAAARLKTLKEFMPLLRKLEKSVQKNAFQQFQALIPELESPDPTDRAAATASLETLKEDLRLARSMRNGKTMGARVGARVGAARGQGTSDRQKASNASRPKGKKQHCENPSCKFKIDHTIAKSGFIGRDGRGGHFKDNPVCVAAYARVFPPGQMDDAPMWYKRWIKC